MPIVIAFANQKGGVGKTTLAAQFAYFLRLKKNKKVLFLDMDAQGSATETLMNGKPLTGSSTQLLFEDAPCDLKIDQTERGIDLLGSTQNPEAYDVEALPLPRILNPKKHLNKHLEAYDFVVVDCPPSLGRRLAASLILADFVVCPIKLSGYAVSGLKNLFNTIIEIKKNANRHLNILGIAVNEYQDNAVQRDALAAVNEALPNQLFDQRIRSRSPIDIASRGKPIFEVRNGHRAAEEMKYLFEEMLKRIKAHK